MMLPGRPSFIPERRLQSHRSGAWQVLEMYAESWILRIRRNAREVGIRMALGATRGSVYGLMPGMIVANPMKW